MSNTDLPKSQKQELRERALQQRSALPIGDISQKIGENLLAWPIFRQAKRVLFYYPFRNEINLLPLALQKSDTAFYLPKVSGHTIHFLRYDPAIPLQPGKFGIPEPDFPTETYRQPASSDVLLAPGLMFDHAGYRLGYGQGFYDRFLSKLNESNADVITAGITPSCLITETLPHDPWDLPITYLVTENAIVSSET